MRAVLEIFKFCFQFLLDKRLLLMKIRLPDCSQMAINWKNDKSVIICRHDVIVNFIWPCFVSIVNFIHWSKFHVSIITGSGVMAIFIYKALIRNPEIENTSIWGLPNIWRLGLVRDTKFGTNVSNEMLLNAAKQQGYSFYRFWVSNGKAGGGVG